MLATTIYNPAVKDVCAADAIADYHSGRSTIYHGCRGIAQQLVDWLRFFRYGKTRVS